MAIDLEKFLLDSAGVWNEIVRKNDCKAAEEFLTQLTEIGYKFEGLNFSLFCSFMKILSPKSRSFFSSVKAEESETAFQFVFEAPVISDDDGDDDTIEEAVVINEADIETVLPGPVVED
jgi:hypothetical protein